MDSLDPVLIGYLVAAISGIFALFHLLVLAGLIPPTIVWGGKISDRSKLVVMELISLSTITAVGATAFLYSRRIGQGVPSPALNLVIWIFAVIFLLNTIGNMFAKTRFERLAFTPVTALLFILMILLALA